MTVRAVLVIAFLGSSCLLAGCGEALFSCEDRVVAQALSPDELYSATTFIRDCGATTDYSTIVALGEKGREKDLGDRAHWVVVANGKHAVEPEWQGDRVLVVRIREGARLFNSVQAWRDVTVSYQ